MSSRSECEGVLVCDRVAGAQTVEGKEPARLLRINPWLRGISEGRL